MENFVLLIPLVLWDRAQVIKSPPDCQAQRYGTFFWTVPPTDNDSMRTLLTITLTGFVLLSTMAQDNVDLKEMVGFGCYYEGRSTPTVIKVKKLLKSKNYKGISKLLTSKNIGEKYLAVISLQRLADDGQYNLSDNEKDLIAKAKLSDEMVSVCSGCTYFAKVPIKTILKEDNFIGSKYWLDWVLSKK